MILALDCATKTGWCLMSDGKIVESGVQDFSKTRGESNGMLFLKFRAWLRNMLNSNNVKLVVYEAAHHRGGAPTEIGVNLTGRVQEICEEYKLPYATVHTGTLKKFATGKGNADKSEMIAQAAVILRRPPINSDEADAVHIACWAFHQYGV